MTRAAEDLYLTRQALSSSMRNLERELGTKLFDRTSDGVAPTAAADVFSEYVRKESQLHERGERLLAEALEAMRCADAKRTLRLGLTLAVTSIELLRSIVAEGAALEEANVELVDVRG